MLKQIVKTVLCLLVAASSVSVVGPSVFAQLPPPISPWMHMFDRPSNPTLGNFLGGVRPQQDLMRANAAQTSQLQTQQQALQALQQGGGTGGGGAGARNLVGTGAPALAGGGASDARAVLAPPREIPSMQRNPAGFNQYMHYYPPRSMPRKPVPSFSATGRRR